MNTLINELMKNTIVHGELSDDERACFEKVGLNNCVVRTEDGWVSANKDCIFHSWRTYRIKSSYKPKPEIDWIEVKQESGILKRWGFYYIVAWRNLIEAPNFPNFHGYKDVNGIISTKPRYMPVGNGRAGCPKFVGFVKEQ